MRHALTSFAIALAAASLVLVLVTAGARGARASSVPLVSSTSAGVTIYAASWCSACKSLEQGLRDRDVPFDVVDVEQSPRAYEVARRATGVNVIPITSVAKSADAANVKWVVGADVGAVERAYRGE